MTDRCEPPPELRAVSGWHWLAHPGWGDCPARYSPPDNPGAAALWRCPDSTWADYVAHRAGWRYLGPVTPHAEVDALRAEVERLRPAVGAGALRIEQGMKPEDVPWHLLSTFFEGAADGCGIMTVPMDMLRHGLAAVADLIAAQEKERCIASITTTKGMLEALTGSADHSWMLDVAADEIRHRTNDCAWRACDE